MNPADPLLFVWNWFKAPFMQMVDYFQTGHPIAGIFMLVIAAILYAILFFGVWGLILRVRHRPRRVRRTTTTHRRRWL